MGLTKSSSLWGYSFLSLCEQQWRWWLRLAQAPWSAEGTSLAQYISLHHFFSTFFCPLCPSSLLLDYDQYYSKGCWCCGINVFVCRAKLPLFRRFSCAGTAKLWISVHVPVVPVECKGQTLRCAVDPYRLTKMPKWLMDSWFSCSKKIVTAKVEMYRQFSHVLNADSAP